MPLAAVLMSGALRIWSAAIVMESQAWRADRAIAVATAARTPNMGAGGAPARRPAPHPPTRARARHAARPAATGLLEEPCRQERREGGGQHHAFDADVHDAGALVHDSAHR